MTVYEDEISGKVDQICLQACLQANTKRHKIRTRRNRERIRNDWRYQQNVQANQITYMEELMKNPHKQKT